MVSKHFRGTRECWSPRTFRYSIYIRTVSSWLFLVHLNLSLLVFDLKMMATSGLDSVSPFRDTCYPTRPILPFWSDFFSNWAAATVKGLTEFQNKKFYTTFHHHSYIKNVNFKTRDVSLLIE